MTPQNRARLKLIGIFAIFFAPLGLAFVLYYGVGYRGDSGTNAGHLVDPARPLPSMALYDGQGNVVSSRKVFQAGWTLLTVAPQGCGAACTAALRKTRQVRALTHRDIDRVQRVLLVARHSRPVRPPQQPDLRVFGADVSGLGPLFAPLGADKPGTIYLIDPLGNWMLYYPPSENGDGLFKDLKHLLKLSHIG